MAAELSPFDPVDRLVGIGPKLKQTLAEGGVHSMLDLLLHLPLRYEDRSRAVPLAEACEPDRLYLVRARATQVVARRGRRRGSAVVRARLEDASGQLPAVWFNQSWIADRLRESTELFLYGAVHTSPSGVLELVHPEVDEVDELEPAEGLIPVYPALGSLRGRRLRRLVQQAVAGVAELEDPLPGSLRQELDLPGLTQAIRCVHAPPVPAPGADIGRLLARLNRRQSPAHRRLAFDELLAFCCGVAEYRARRLGLSAPRCSLPPRFDALVRRLLPFELTDAQQRVLAEIVHDLEQGHPMARLVQGDVGSGKTVVAALAMLVALESGYQGALMAPTELLAEQHHRTLTSLLQGSSYRPELLCSSQPGTERRRVLEGLADGSLRLVVGTHALIQEAVAFHRLGLVVVDEQHRFGVAQRQALLDKGEAPHLLVMTATPIPRTLALTVYGDLELSVIDQMPPGRRPVRTVLRTASAKARLYDFLRQELVEGGRVFVVCPLIEASATVQARALEAHVSEVRCELGTDRVGVLHGRMPAAEQDAVYARFRDGSVPVLLATTVIEVGIDVPEASVMVIESPERFGLAQLHQLRGRVGRGERESWCVLLAEEDSPRATRRRLEALCRSNDGFVLAEADLRLRGPGEVTGTRQWGPSQFRLADLVSHRALVPRAQAVAKKLAESGELRSVREALARFHRVEVDLPAG